MCYSDDLAAMRNCQGLHHDVRDDVRVILSREVSLAHESVDEIAAADLHMDAIVKVCELLEFGSVKAEIRPLTVAESMMISLMSQVGYRGHKSHKRSTATRPNEYVKNEPRHKTRRRVHIPLCSFFTSGSSEALSEDAEQMPTSETTSVLASESLECGDDTPVARLDAN
eukprot:CAMPEP_0203889316 /NCGR_PEP_ID=MMETSP0359-20131031/32879_1 /ASSEMBLY_ACC=CAM_ASM_000338 /TAXON_ID=268821 /ORGANISM="Scrippsiella Hangoei, Strain SHTV-5" /LENGTH=168 /DNA_ID=CAMNT_0050810707 /DNA_START=23 /DNA_END=530 /DNA_ORIENTATION=+